MHLHDYYSICRYLAQGKEIIDKIADHSQFSASDSQVDNLDWQKCLNVIVDKNLNLKEHSNNLRAKAYRAVGFLRYSMKFFLKTH